MYALMRNTSKFIARDKRKFKNQYLEYDILAPDTVNEMFDALREIEYAVGKAFENEQETQDYESLGREILSQDIDLSQKEILLHKTEHSNRKVILIKVRECYTVFKKMMRYYASTLLADYILSRGSIAHFIQNKDQLKTPRLTFDNIGGQLVPSKDVATLISRIKDQTIGSWEEIHQTYHSWSQEYPFVKLRHAVASLEEITNVPLEDWTADFIVHHLQESVETKNWVYHEIHHSRAKDYQNPFKQMVYNSEEEMETVVGKLADNVFISNQKEELEHYKKKVRTLVYGS